ETIQDFSSCRCGVLGGLGDAVEEEREPSLPVSVLPHIVQQLVVVRAMLLEVQAEIKKRVAENTGIRKHQRDEQPSDTAIAVEERMDRFELHVRQRGADEHRQPGLIVNEFLESAHALIDKLRRRRNE